MRKQINKSYDKIEDEITQISEEYDDADDELTKELYKTQRELDEIIDKTSESTINLAILQASGNLQVLNNADTITNTIMGLTAINNRDAYFDKQDRLVYSKEFLYDTGQSLLNKIVDSAVEKWDSLVDFTK